MIGKNTMITKVVRDIESGHLLERRLRWTDHPFARLMGVRINSVFTNVTANLLPANATETAILVTPPMSPPLDNAAVLIFWFFSIVAGTATTSITTRVRRGNGVTGAVIGFSGIHTLAAGANAILSGVQIDNSPGVVAGQQYSLTVVQTAATGAGTLNDNAMIAMVL